MHLHHYCTHTWGALISLSSITSCSLSLIPIIMRAPRKDLLHASTALWALNSSPSTRRVTSHSSFVSYRSCEGHNSGTGWGEGVHEKATPGERSTRRRSLTTEGAALD